MKVRPNDIQFKCYEDKITRKPGSIIRNSDDFVFDWHPSNEYWGIQIWCCLCAFLSYDDELKVQMSVHWYFLN